MGDSADQDAPQLPPEMNAFVNFIKSIGSYEGGNKRLIKRKLFDAYIEQAYSI